MRARLIQLSAITATVTTSLVVIVPSAAVTAEDDVTAPTIVAEQPHGDSVPVGSNVTVQFSEPMDGATVNGATVLLATPADETSVLVPATVTYDEVTLQATLDPGDALFPATDYTATVQSGGVQDLAGNPLAADHTWDFTTLAGPDETPPAVTAFQTDPPGQPATAVDADVTVAFSESMRAGTIDGATVLLTTAGTGAPVTATVTYDDITWQARLDPETALAHATEYRATVVGGVDGVADVSGNTLTEDPTWNFTTAAAPDETPPEVTGSQPQGADVPIDSTVRVEFSEPMNGTTIDDATVLLATSGGDPVAATVTYDPGSDVGPFAATLQPAVPLAHATDYAATVVGGTGGVTDVAGNPLADNHVWTFSTTAAPDVTPPDTAIESAPSGTVASTSASVTFSATETGATFGCVVDGGAAAPCTSPLELSGLAEGPHGVSVSAIDAAGNTDASPATASWTVDTLAPSVTAAPAGGTYTSAQSVTLTASEPATIHYTTDGTAPTASSPAYSTPIAVAATTTLRYLAVDGAGNTSAPVTQSYVIQTAPATVTFSPAADAKVTLAQPGSNFGTQNPLVVDSEPAEESFLRFDVSGVTGTVTSAELRLYATNATVNGPTVYATDAGWSETSINWNNRPARLGSAADDLGIIGLNTWASYNVTSLVTGNGAVSFNLGRVSSDAVQFQSREATNASLRPVLVVTYAGGPPPPPPVTVGANPAGGTYTTSQAVALSASEPATIHYTTDGSTPTTASPAYAAPVAVTTSTTLRFFAVATSDGRSSSVVTEEYVIKAGAPTTSTFAPVADARVESNNPTSTLGTAPTLIADSSPATESYLRFQVAGLTGPVTNARLRLFVFNETGNGPAVYSAANSWDEAAINWNNRPARTGSGLDDKGTLPVNTWVEYDVTPLVSGNGTVTVVLATTSSDGVSMYARESSNTALRPELVVTAEQGTPPAVTATPAGGSYTGPVDVTLAASEPASIHYTTDGSAPTAASPVYSSAIHVAATTTLRFIGIDAGGATSSPGTETYTIAGDFDPPETTIGVGPPALTNQTEAMFTFSSDEAAATFACSLDGAGYSSCSSPHPVTGLAAGSHTFAVKAIDAAGNEDGTPPTATWTVDTTAPTVTGTEPAAGATDVATNVIAIAALSEDLDATTVTTATITLVRTSNQVPVTATVGFDPVTDEVSVDPAADLAPGATYDVTVRGGSGGVRDLAGNPLSGDVAWSFTTASVAAPATITLSPVADAWVDSSSPNVNYGTATTLTADTNPDSRSYLKFAVAGTSGPITSARLRLYASTSTKDGPTVQGAGNGWTETGLTWNNKPATIGGVLDDVPNVTARTWVEYNVSPLVTGNGTVVIAVVPESSDGIDFNSREAADNRPQLVVSYGGVVPTVTATPGGGSYPGPVDVTLTPSEQATIHYTTDGSVPTTASAVYTAPIDVSITQTIRFFAVTPDGRTSTLSQESYQIDITGYRGPAYGSTGSAPTAKEGQSKLWYTPDGWFGAMFDAVSGDFHIFRLDAATQTWTDTGTLIDTRNRAIIDTLWDGSKLYTVSAVWSTASSGRAELRRYSYANGAYTLDAGFNPPVVLNSTGSEAVVMTKAADGRLWVTYTASSKVFVTHSSLGNDAAWTTPFQIPVPGGQSSVTTDDISSIVAFGNRVGVLWSNQNANAMYFASRDNTAPDTNSWTIETAYAVPGQESADDHINVKVGNDGRIYAAVKTSLNEDDEPLIHLLVRGVNGGWSSHVWGTAQFKQTRPIVVLDEEDQQVHVLASGPRAEAVASAGCCDGGVVYEKVASMAALDFPSGIGDVVLASSLDPRINNVTSTKQPVTDASGLVILAGDDTTDFYLHNVLN